MASKVGIINSALVKIGKSALTTLTGGNGGNADVNVMNVLYDILLEDLLASHPWNFATKRAKLAQTVDVPVSRFDHEYQLPTDWLRTVKVSDNDEMTGRTNYQEEDGKILANSDDIYLVYISKVTDPNKMTVEFRETFAFRLAADSAIPIANSKSLAEQMMQRYEKWFRKARSIDTMGDQPPRMPVGSWTSARFGRFGGFFDPR